MTRYAGKRYNKSPKGTKAPTGTNPNSSPTEARFFAGGQDRTQAAQVDRVQRWTGRTGDKQNGTPPTLNRQAMPLMPSEIRDKNMKKSYPVPRKSWKFRQMVSEIPRGRQNRTKKSLESGLNVPKWGTIKPRRGDARLVWGDISPDGRKYGVGIAVGWCRCLM